MSLFKRNNNSVAANGNNFELAEIALKSINDGVVILDRAGIIRFVNPAALRMIDFNPMLSAVGLDYRSVFRLESKEGRELSDQENPLVLAVANGEAVDAFRGSLIVGNTNKRVPVSVSVINAEGGAGDKVVTLRNIAKELEEEGAQTEFISTASHEMRTPVASIEGYLSLALNPQTATIDARAQGYLTAAHTASKHLGKLFQDLLDVTKLDDRRIRPEMVPVEMVSTVRQMSDAFYGQFPDLKISYTFGSTESMNDGSGVKLDQVVYGYVDIHFLQEIMDNLLDNAMKYTPAGGSVWVNVRGDGDRVLINVTDTGIGISADDIQHIFQKFYRADNSDTREIGGTGLGLYLVKQRVEAIGGRIWVESGFGEGSTFFVSLPRLTSEEYQKRIAIINNQKQFSAQMNPQPAPAPASTIQTAAQMVQQPVQQPAPQPAPQPAQQPVPQPAPQPVQQPIQQPAPQPQIVTQQYQQNNGGTI